jgi:hypothetical protein
MGGKGELRSRRIDSRPGNSDPTGRSRSTTGTERSRKGDLALAPFECQLTPPTAGTGTGAGVRVTEPAQGRGVRW